jgi:hypothetical protein
VARSRSDKTTRELREEIVSEQHSCFSASGVNPHSCSTCSGGVTAGFAGGFFQAAHASEARIEATGETTAIRLPFGMLVAGRDVNRSRARNARSWKGVKDEPSAEDRYRG